MTLEQIQYLDFQLSLAERAAAAYEVRKREGEAELLVMAQDLIHEILDVTNGQQVKVNPKDKNVVLEIEGVKFKAQRMAMGGEMVPRLFVWTGQDWKHIKDLAELGEFLSV